MNSKLRETLKTLQVKSVAAAPQDLYMDFVDEAEKAIRQVVGEEMLGLVGNNEYGNIGYDGEEVVDETTEEMLYRNQLRAELRQKIKQWQGGEDE